MTIAAKSALALAVALAFGAPALAQPSSDKTPCFWTRDLRNHTVADERTLYFDVGGRSVYRVSMSNNCLVAVTSSDPIIMRDFAGTGRICHKMDVDIAVRGNRCIVESITRLSPPEVAALPKKVKP